MVYTEHMSLQRIPFDTYNRSVRDVLRGGNEDFDATHLIFDPPYQRASVWTHEQRVNLIKSSLQGLPVGVIFINDRGYKQGGDAEFAVVDGKQRLETYLMFFRGQLRIPSEWFEDGSVEPSVNRPGLDVSWHDLTVIGRRRVGNDFTLSQYQTKLATVEQEEELYLRINYGGTPHEPLETR